MPKKVKPTVLEICAGAGGQALGLEKAGFQCVAAVEIDKHAVATLRVNRRRWNVVHSDVRQFDATPFTGVDLFAGGVPCPPFTTAGEQLGRDDERDMFPEALRLIAQSQPKAFLLENVAGFLATKFEGYRTNLLGQLSEMGFICSVHLIQASDLGVPQLRPRVVIVGLRPKYAKHFSLKLRRRPQKTVGAALQDLMAQDGWLGAFAWAEKANKVAPTLVGGSKKHGGADLGPTRAKRQWAELGVNGLGVANGPPPASSPIDFRPMLTIRMAARIQGFPDSWKFVGKKTNEYRQIGNAFPPPVASFVGRAIMRALLAGE